MLVHDLDILLVEDDPLDAELMMTALKRWKDDTQIRLLTDGVEALDYIFATGPFSDRKIESLPKVIFLDLKLPKLDGLEVLRRIRDDERTREVPVVIFSSSHEDRDIRESYKRGANSYVVKPMDSEEFMRTVSEIGHYWTHVNERAASDILKVF